MGSLLLAVIYLAASAVIALGYSIFYFEATLPNGSVGQLLDIADYISNSVLMPIVAFLTCIFIGWVIKPKTLSDEIKISSPFKREKMFSVIIKFVAPVCIVAILISSVFHLV